MELQSREIHNRVLGEVAKKYNLTRRDAQRVLKMYADYTYAGINSIQPDEDLAKQHTRFIFPEVGGVRVRKEFFIFNEWKFGRLPKEILQWCYVWFKNTLRFHQRFIKFKIDID